ncbi:MAG: hypothetical protein OZ915_12290, partial [Ignavibacteriales bacterium]|nr:hypothetical protein [Ignavibacteria bacterium]MEB2355946.1 hypothetical protein [Ignavibacteriales bacterium]
MKIYFIVLMVAIICRAQTQDKFVNYNRYLPEFFCNKLDTNKIRSLSACNYFNLIEIDTIHQRMDSIIANSLAGGSLKFVFEYNSNSNIIEQLILSKNLGSEWELSSKNEYFYDEDGRLVLFLILGWNEMVWDSLARIIYKYDSIGQLTKYIFQGFKSYSWVNYSRFTFLYDYLGNEIQILEEEWNNAWLNKYLISNYYSNSNRRDSLLFQFWNTNGWENYGKTAFSYNLQTQFLEFFLSKLWVAGSWVNYLNRKITNDQNGNQILQLDQIWNGVIWGNTIRRFFTFDGLNYTLTAFCEQWNGSQWISGDGDIIIENPDGYSVAFLNTNNVSIFYIITMVEDEPNLLIDNFKLEQNYPNPFNSTTNIKYTIPQSGRVTLTVYDMMGSEVAVLLNRYQEAGSYDVIF